MFKIRIFCLFLMGILGGCMSMQPMDENLTAEQIYQEIQPGDEIIVTTKDQTKTKVIVTKVTKEQIESEKEIFRFDEITEIQKEGVSVWKTTAAVFGITQILGVFMFAALISI